MVVLILWFPSSIGHKETAELLIAKGANVNPKNDRGWNPLHYALPAPQAQTTQPAFWLNPLGPRDYQVPLVRLL